jgi:sugar (pentulose or hexulose) kinase
VLTAVEDFVSAGDGLRLAIVPAFFGLGVVWHRDAPWADAVAAAIGPWDRNPLLERMEANRVFHLASAHAQLVRASRSEELLRRLLESSAFSLAERLSRVRRRAGVAPEQSVVSKEAVRRVLSE